MSSKYNAAHVVSLGRSRLQFVVSGLWLHWVALGGCNPDLNICFTPAMIQLQVVQ